MVPIGIHHAIIDDKRIDWKMKIALTVWENRISPVFDVANMILLAEIQNGGVLSRQFVPFNPAISLRLGEMLKGMGVSVLICGAISNVPANILTFNGIQLIPFISGETETILAAYAKGNPIIPAFSMPGIGKQCHRRRKKQIFILEQKEAAMMPRGDGTGPLGQGGGSGKGRGGCKRSVGTPDGQGKGTGQGRGRRDGQGQGQRGKKQ
jgi:predicted Fe-Mo cluster-binding NifX family protein